MADYLDNWRGFLSSVEIGMVFCGGRRRSKRLIRGTIGLNICGIVSGRFLTIVHKSRRPFLRRLISLTYDQFSGVTGRPIKSVTLRRMERKEVTVPGQGMIKGWITGRMARTCRISQRPARYRLRGHAGVGIGGQWRGWRLFLQREEQDGSRKDE